MGNDTQRLACASSPLPPRSRSAPSSRRLASGSRAPACSPSSSASSRRASRLRTSRPTSARSWRSLAAHRSSRRPVRSASTSSSSCSRSASSPARRSQPRDGRRPTSSSRRCSRSPSGERAGSAGESLSVSRASPPLLSSRACCRGRAPPRRAPTSRSPRCSRPASTACPTSLLFLALASLAYGLIPRASTGIAYGLVSVAFVWQLFGSLIGAPQWIVDLSPFQHVGLVPAQPFHVTAAIVMVALAAVGALASMWAFRRRDLTAA